MQFCEQKITSYAVDVQLEVSVAKMSTTSTVSYSRRVKDIIAPHPLIVVKLLIQIPGMANVHDL